MADKRDVLLVDGYNIIGAWPELFALTRFGLQEARNRLLERLADHQSYSGRKVIVIFDAYRVLGIGKTFSHSKVQVYFTKEKETADECIERLVRELSSRRRSIYVATSDLVEQHVAFGQGALRLSARELLVEVEESERNVQKQIEQNTQKVHRNTLNDALSPEMKKMFEKWRRK